MKHTGCTCYFARERERAIMDAYRRELRAPGSICFETVIDNVLAAPSPRFWVSEERAMVVVSLLSRGIDVLSRMHSSKRRMFAEIYSRYLALRSKSPDSTLSALVSQVVYSPSPELYLSATYVKRLISTYRNKCHKK